MDLVGRTDTHPTILKIIFGHAVTVVRDLD